jgi:hypothetical protein
MGSRQTYLGYADAAAQVLTSKWFPRADQVGA